MSNPFTFGPQRDDKSIQNLDVVPTPSLSTSGLTDEFTSMFLGGLFSDSFEQISVCPLRVVWPWGFSSPLVRFPCGHRVLFFFSGHWGWIDLGIFWKPLF